MGKKPHPYTYRINLCIQKPSLIYLQNNKRNGQKCKLKLFSQNECIFVNKIHTCVYKWTFHFNFRWICIMINEIAQEIKSSHHIKYITKYVCIQMSSFEIILFLFSVQFSCSLHQFFG